MKLTADRAFADPEKAARKLLEIANATEAVQDGRILCVPKIRFGVDAAGGRRKLAS